MILHNSGKIFESMASEDKRLTSKMNPQLDPNFYQSKGSSGMGAEKSVSPAKPGNYRIQIGTDEIRMIVSALNNPPFVMNLTLVSFDEKSPLELLELLNTILATFDDKHKVDIRKETQEQTAGRITEFLKVLDFPGEMDMPFQRALVQGDKRVIYSVLYFLLSQYEKNKKRAYLSHFLMGIEVPSHYLVDEEMNGYNQKLKELQAEFQATIQHVDQQRTEAVSPKELEQKITQLGQEKEQLVAKTSSLKKKNANTQEFQDLVDSVSQLRKEQEEGSKLYEKYIRA